MTLDKTYQPDAIEARHYTRWRDAALFAADVASTAKPYTIMMPPPNVTGSLHIGHALTFTIQDILIRYHRMAGRDALWQPGTDHAGIATQMVVERQLAEEGKTRHDLGRETFVERVWQWRRESGGTILNQLVRLGASADWDRERFTMDEGLSAAVLKVFVDLYKEGLIYRDKRLVNWDPNLHTAISDLEVEQREEKGHLWHFRYPIDGEPGRFITVATTRPETMLGDTAVAVHPEDERYKGLVGKHAVLPIAGRRIPIVADEHADPEQGSGAVKITPAHDFNDFAVGQRHDLPMVNVLDADAHMALDHDGFRDGCTAGEFGDPDAAVAAYHGLDRYEARDAIVGEMERRGLLERTDDHVLMMPYGDRSGVVIEPWLTDQWFVDAKTLAEPAIKAVEEGRTRFVPRQWENVYFEWMRNIQPWCVSRQIWWGHQIPAWFGPDGTIFVEMSEEEAKAAAREHFGEDVTLERETDVLDTWFSSALWPFSTLGWPERTPELERYYPGDVLVTGFDIIFFWVARMMMMGIHFMGEVPFREVYIHALVRDAKGQKMSKSKGNVMDPLDLIERYGADAVRFTLAALAAQGRDIKLSESRIEGYRNFATKIWNAARYIELNDGEYPTRYRPELCRQTVNAWIVGLTARTMREATEALDAYRFNEAAGALYHFTWHSFCDWYIEFTKPIFAGDDEAAKTETRATLLWVLDQILHLLHPFMPFISEELRVHFWGEDAPPLIRGGWPVAFEGLESEEDIAEIEWVIRVITQVRAVRAETNVPAGARIRALVIDAGEATRARLERHRGLIARLARLEAIEPGDKVPEGSAQIVVEEAVVALPLAHVIDIDREKARLGKEIDKVRGEIDKLDKKLSNQNFVAKAPPEVVEEQRERRAEYEQTQARLEEALGRLAAA